MTDIAPSPAKTAAIATASGHAHRRDLLDQISNFLLENGLDVNPGNLALAQAVFSGSNARLSRQILARQLADEPVTKAWLDELASQLAPDTDSPVEPGGRASPPVHPDAAPDNLPAQADRDAIEVLLEREYRTARSTSEPLSIALCDIDGIAAINDTHGHDTGDRVIQAIARVLQRVAGQNCHVARDGGEAFVLLFRGLTPDRAGQELDHARQSFAQRKLVDRKTRKTIGSVTFSGGVADILAYADPREALKAATEALQAAKEQGRNRIVVAGTEAPASLTQAPPD